MREIPEHLRDLSISGYMPIWDLVDKVPYWDIVGLSVGWRGKTWHGYLIHNLVYTNCVDTIRLFHGLRSLIAINPHALTYYLTIPRIGSDDLLSAETIQGVIIYHSNGLHVSVANGGTHKFKLSLTKVLAHLF